MSLEAGPDLLLLLESAAVFMYASKQTSNRLSLFRLRRRCDFFGAIMVLATCMLSVGLKDTLSSAAVGLAISNTIQVRGSRREEVDFPRGFGRDGHDNSIPILSHSLSTLSSQVLVFFTWVVRGAAETVSMW